MHADKDVTRRPKLLLFGAGATGRGQIAQLAFESGWELSLVDVKKELVDLLRRAGYYRVRLIGLDKTAREITIDRFRIFHVDEVRAIVEEVVSADLVVTSVLATNLEGVAPLLAEGLASRSKRRPDAPLNVIAAENMEHSSTVLRGLVLAHLDGAASNYVQGMVGFPDSMIARVVPIPEDPLLVVGEEFSEWTADRRAIVGTLPPLQGLELVENQEARFQRKLFIHNTGHACCGLCALARGYRYIHEGARDPRIRAEVEAVIAESSAAVSLEHGFSKEDVAAYRRNLLERLQGDAFLDSVVRVCREPLRKLGPNERLVGPLNLCIKHGLPHWHLARTIARAITTYLPEEEQYDQMRAMLARGGPELILNEVCGLEEGHPAWDLIMAEIDRFLRERKD